jgi:hypothetical protein
MLRKDYIVRQFEEFGRVLAFLLSSKKDKDWDRFENELQEAVLRFTSFEIDYVESLNEEDFWFEIINHPTLSLDQYKILAGLLFEKLDYYMDRNECENYLNLKAKCFTLYKVIAGNQTQNEFNLDVHYKLEFLKQSENEE